MVLGEERENGPTDNLHGTRTDPLASALAASAVDATRAWEVGLPHCLRRLAWPVPLGGEADRYMIYLLVDPITLEIRYVGTALDPQRRFLRHREAAKRGDHFPIYRWWREALTLGDGEPTMLSIDSGSYREERELILNLKLLGARLLNVSGKSGSGHLGHRHIAEARRKISEAVRGKNLGNAWNIGRSLSEETRRRISTSLTGIVRSPETRARISATKTGQSVPIERRLRISETLRRQYEVKHE